MYALVHEDCEQPTTTQFARTTDLWECPEGQGGHWPPCDPIDAPQPECSNPTSASDAADPARTRSCSGTDAVSNHHSVAQESHPSQSDFRGYRSEC